MDGLIRAQINGGKKTTRPKRNGLILAVDELYNSFDKYKQILMLPEQLVLMLSTRGLA